MHSERVARCDVALMAYVAGYSCSLFAAALAAELHLLATERGCCVALEKKFGSVSVTICREEAAMTARLRDPMWLAR